MEWFSIRTNYLLWQYKDVEEKNWKMRLNRSFRADSFSPYRNGKIVIYILLMSLRIWKQKTHLLSTHQEYSSWDSNGQFRREGRETSRQRGLEVASLAGSSTGVHQKCVYNELREHRLETTTESGQKCRIRKVSRAPTHIGDALQWHTLGKEEDRCAMTPGRKSSITGLCL